MNYYVVAIEQIHDKENEGQYSEYLTSQKKTTLGEATTAFHTKCAEVSNDLEKTHNHTYMNIKIMNSLGGVEKKDELGSYIEAGTPVE